ncbi:MAG: YCF48-related protein [Flavipsychrobacter sp.]
MKQTVVRGIVLLITLNGILYSSCKKDLLHWAKVEQIHTETYDRLNDVYFISDNIGYAVGGDRFQKATLLRTTDWGKSWKYYDFTQAGKGLYGINTSPSGKLYAIGFDGKMMSSIDKGDNWQFTQLDVWKEYKDIGFFNPNEGLAIGGISYNSGFIMHVDGNGKIQYWDSIKYELNDLAVANATTAYIAGYGVIQKTVDKGKTWRIQNPVNDNFTALHLRTEQELWACGVAGSIYHTSDGGNNWYRQRNGKDITKPKYELHDIYFVDGQNGWAVGENGVIIYSEDSGNNWSLFDKFTSETLRSITMAGDGTLVVVGDNGSIYRLHIKK